MKDFADYDTSFKLKELGFKEKCYGFYYDEKDEYLDDPKARSHWTHLRLVKGKAIIQINK